MSREDVPKQTQTDDVHINLCKTSVVADVLDDECASARFATS